MRLYDTEKIHTVVSGLKEAKTQCFQSINGYADLVKVKEICRIIDTLILPMYYIWEHCCRRQLEELDFEKHLEKPYQKFLQNPLTYTWELYLFISIKTPFEDVLQNKKLSKELFIIIKELVDKIECNN